MSNRIRKAHTRTDPKTGKKVHVRASSVNPPTKKRKSVPTPLITAGSLKSGHLDHPLNEVIRRDDELQELGLDTELDYEDGTFSSKIK